MSTAKRVVTGEALAALRRIQERIQRNPLLMDMEHWVVCPLDARGQRLTIKSQRCGVVACIAGHIGIDEGWTFDDSLDEVAIASLPVAVREEAVRLAKTVHMPGNYGFSSSYIALPYAAAAFLQQGLAPGVSVDWRTLFFPSYWPAGFAVEFDDAAHDGDGCDLDLDDPKIKRQVFTDRAEITARRIEHFIETGN